MFTFPRTKIQPPRQRSGLLRARPALDARLSEALLSQRLVLVCAAAGYGKTSALASQADALPAGTALAWVSCDAGDLPLQLFQCLVSALEPFDPPWRVEPEALIQRAASDGTPAATQRALRTMVAELINALDACEVPHGVIVVDDLHRVEHPTVYAFLDLLLERFTPRWTMAIASRHEPPIALARLRALGELAEFRTDDLRFDRDEALGLAASAGVDTTAAGALFERTQGWPVALRLALHVLTRRGPAGEPAPAIDRPIFDFLAAEVFDRLTPDLREFLLLTCVLPELTAARCAALTGDPQAAGQLERIERAGFAVVTLGGSELTLRLHDLLRDALLQRLLREQPQALPILYAKAAASEPDPGRRLDYLLHAGDQPAAAMAMVDHAPDLLVEGSLSTVQSLLERFDPAWAARSPDLHYVRGLLAWARWDFDAMNGAMQRAQELWQTAGDGDRAQLAFAYRSLSMVGQARADRIDGDRLARARGASDLETRLIALLASQWRALETGDLRDIGPLLDAQMDLLETTSDLSLWYRAHTVARLNGLPGTGRGLDRYVDGALRRTAGQITPLRAMAQAQRALRETWQGLAGTAEQTLTDAHADARWLGNPPNVSGNLRLASMLVAAHRGRHQETVLAARSLITDHLPYRGPWSHAFMMFYAARAVAAFDDREALNEHLTRLESLQHRVPPAVVAMIEPLRGIRAWLDRDTTGAMARWEAAIAMEDRVDWLGSAIEWRVRLAAARLTQGQDAAAITTLEPAARRVAGHAGVGGVLLARTALTVLAGAATQGRLGPTLGATVLRWQALAGTAATAPVPAAKATPAAAPVPAGGLSSRELEVLARIAAGDSNKLIARAFDISPHTVKHHVANILDKLDLRSRGQAAAWYRDHGAARA